MSFSRLRILLTGATGGIGLATARELAARGAALLVTGRDGTALAALLRDLALPEERCLAVPADLADTASRARLVVTALNWQGGVNTLVNNAGVGHLAMFGDQTPADLDAALTTNVSAPLQLCHALLPQLRSLPEAHIVNVGSVFGAIGYPGYAVYSATKFALRGFSEALARELADTRVQVHYLAPRATHTPMNGAAADALNASLGVTVDPPERVAAALCDMLASGRRRGVIGWPEKLFARLNGVLPGVIDRALARQLPQIRRHALQASVAHAAARPLTDSRRKLG